MTKPEVVTTKQAAAMLGLEVRAVATRVKVGTLTPAVKLTGLRGAYVFYRSDIEAQAKDGAK